MHYGCNVLTTTWYSNRQNADIVVIKIKDSRQAFDLKRMSFPLTHTAFFRVIGFDWYGKFPEGTYRSGYGHNIRQEFGEEKATKLIRQFTGNDKAVVLYGSSILYRDQEHIKEVLKNESGNSKC